MSEILDRAAALLRDLLEQREIFLDERASRMIVKGVLTEIREPSATMFMRGGNVPISNVGRKGEGRRGRIGDMAAKDAWSTMVLVIASEPDY